MFCMLHIFRFAKILALVLASFSFHHAESQIIDNRLGNALKEEMFFNQQFLWSNKVKTMTGTTSIKRTIA